MIALRHISQQENGDVCSTREIADTYDIPYELLAKTLQQLARADIITAIQGPRGGYRIKKAMNKLNLMEFIELIEGPVGISDCNLDDDCQRTDICNIRQPITRVNENIRTIFSNITLDEITL